MQQGKRSKPPNIASSPAQSKAAVLNAGQTDSSAEGQLKLVKAEVLHWMCMADNHQAFDRAAWLSLQGVLHAQFRTELHLVFQLLSWHWLTEQ